MGLVTLKKRREFLRLRGGSRWATAAVIVETRPRPRCLPAVSSSAKATRSSDEPAVAEIPKSEKLGTGAKSSSCAGPPRFGFTVTKRIGNAVTRNFVRRRMKEAIRELAKDNARPGYDYVVIAKSAILACGYEQLTRDLKTALERVHQSPSRSRRNHRNHRKRSSRPKEADHSKKPHRPRKQPPKS